MSPRQTGFLQVGIASVCFGFLGIFGKQAYAQAVSLGDVLVARFTFATLILLSILALFSPAKLRISRRQLLICAGLGLFGYALFASLYFAAIEGISVALAAMLLYTFPFWTALMNHFTGHPLTRLQWLALGGALVGLVFLLWGHLDVRSLVAILYGLGSAVAYATYIVVSGRFQQGVPALTSGFYIILFAALGLGLFHQPDLSTWRHFTPAQATPILGLVVICTLFPLTLIQAGLQRLSSFETSLLSMIEPVTASFAAWILLDEKLGPWQLLGALLILGSLILVSRKANPT